LPSGPVTVVDLKWHGDSALEVTYKDMNGHSDSTVLYRAQEPLLTIEASGAKWAYDGDGHALKLVSEAYRIHLAHLFDPWLAIHTSNLEPLPHQITAVYEEMLRRQPLRFLLADDPGAGKTIMTGLFIKELIIRGDLERCLIVCPGNLTEQWQDELWDKCHLDFEIVGRQAAEASRDSDPFRGKKLVITRLDMLSRNEDLQKKLKPEGADGPDWDLIVCDEAHKMSAHLFGNEVKQTKRYKLGQLLGSITRHFLLLTATPHNGKPEDFQLFMALLDPDRFEIHARGGREIGDVSDLLRRLNKESLLRFDGRPLFPERKAYTVKYQLSEMEHDLYEKVTAYVREEMNRAERLTQSGEKRRGNMVGFALTVLQRRLASSPEAIYRSIERRRKRLEKRLEETKTLREKIMEATGQYDDKAVDLDFTSDEELQEDLDEAASDELEQLEDDIVDEATAARTIAELETEIATLRDLEERARKVRISGTDKKWEELSKILQDVPEMFDASGARRKLVLFTEHRDTVNYLVDRMQRMLGRSESLVVIHGGLHREARKKAQNDFINDKTVHVLVATDAAGEGINLQRAHLMVNYDLPWNPNRLEQRFGRIHRIGQEEVCHLWNIVADGTREGAVYERLLEKLKSQYDALNGKVFDVLGKLFMETSLRDLLIEAVRYGDDPDTKRRLFEKVDAVTDMDHVLQVWQENALSRETMDASRVMSIREDMERIEARRLQPHFISSFFRQAFAELGGTIRERETLRYEITHVPAEIRRRETLLPNRYERVTFHKDKIHETAKPPAEFLCPGHPLLNAVLELVQQRYGDLLQRGAILVDPLDVGDQPRRLYFVRHAIKDASKGKGNDRRTISERLQFVELDAQGNAHKAGYAPYLDYQPLPAELKETVSADLANLLPADGSEDQIQTFAVTQLIPEHLNEVQEFQANLVQKTRQAVHARLTKEIAYWDRQANNLKAQELSGKKTRLSSGRARERADKLEQRLKRRMDELDLEARIMPSLPVVIGGALILPQGLLQRYMPKPETEPPTFARETRESELLAMQAVMEVEARAGRVPKDVSADKCGYDIESAIPGKGKLLFIEVKGRVAGATTVIVTKNEIMTALNKPEDFVLAIVPIEDGKALAPCYVSKPFLREPDFGVTSVMYDLKNLLSRGESPP
jgi:hypothetical protein